jgi:ABC-type Fe3+ transport system permease subunit
MSTTPVIVACFAVAVIAWLHHAIYEHHWLKIIAHKVSPAVAVPETRHDSMWHAMSHGMRIAVDLALIAAAVCLGIAWQLERTATTVVIVAGMITWLAWRAAIATSRAIGRRHQPRPEPDLEMED